MSEYKGSLFEGNRARQIEQERKEREADFNERKAKMKQTSSQLKDMKRKFAVKEGGFEDKLGEQTVGLVSFEDFRKKRQRLQAEDRKGSTSREKGQTVSKTNKSGLSFADDESDDSDSDEDTVTLPLVAKNPEVDTSFLPDKNRQAEERNLRDSLSKEFLLEQERIKGEVIPVTFSFWDGTGHRRTLNVRKGTTIGKFLNRAREDFKDLRKIPTENLIFIKEDVIIPQNYTFYDLIVNRARGKSGPLWDMGAHEDISLREDVRRERNEAHAAKVVERHWYEQNKHIFPASRWEVWNPAKDYSKKKLTNA